MDFHPIANIFPMLPAQELEDLAADIKANGLNHKITTYQNQILDGRNRFVACELAFVEPQFVEYTGDNPVAFVISENLKRRHLSPSQAAAAAIEALPLLEQEAKERMSQGGGDKKSGSQKIDTPIINTGRSTDHAARLFGTNRQYVADAKRLKEQAPELFDAVAAGEISIPEAKKEYKKREISQLEDLIIPSFPAIHHVSMGDWWQLDRHTIFCGDTSTAEFIDKAPAVEFAFADPPYNAGVADWDNNFNWKHDWLMEKAKVVSVTPGIASIFDFAKITNMPYAWSMSCWIDNGMTRGALGFGNWIYIALFSKETLYRQSQDVIRVSIKLNDDRMEFKGRKPPQMIGKLFDLFADDKTVIDPFLGSGTTLLVAEEFGLTCFGGDINPENCGAIIDTWENKTKKKATKL